MVLFACLCLRIKLVPNTDAVCDIGMMLAFVLPRRLMNVEVTNHYVIAELYNMHSGMSCLVVSLCVVSRDNVGSSLNSFSLQFLY